VLGGPGKEQWVRTVVVENRSSSTIEYQLNGEWKAIIRDSRLVPATPGP
jgi:hypothetical protein